MEPFFSLIGIAAILVGTVVAPREFAGWWGLPCVIFGPMAVIGGLQGLGAPWVIAGLVLTFLGAGLLRWANDGR